MADEPRRSGRSTKGQHKNLDLVADTPAKKSKLKSQSKDKHAKNSVEPTPTPSEEEEEIIRCICGEYEEEEDVERDMICCDQCSAWQHNDCMGLTFAKGEEPDQYFCEQCKPENHKELLAKMERGERPWEEAAERRRKEAEEKRSRRRKGKKGGRRGRPSEAKTEASTPARTATSTTPAPAQAPQSESAATPGSEKHDDNADARSTSAQKRKFEDNQDAPTPEPGPKSKQQKTSPPTDGTPPSQPARVKQEASDHGSLSAFFADHVATGGAKTIEEISNSARKSAATALSRLFVDQLSEAQKRGAFNLPNGKSKEEVAQQLALAIEHAIYQNICGGSGEPTEPYKLQLRTILFNVKKNSSLRDRLLVGSLSPDALSKMSSQDMASEELQQKDAEIKREADRQHFIVQEQGPRIRRTHKGEEFIEDENQTASSEPVFSNAPARRSIAETEGSPAGSPVQPSTEKAGSRKSSKTQANDPKPTPHDEHFPTRSHSPGGTSHDQVFPEVATNIREPVPTGRVQADAEIDQLLKDDEPESPPYSPKDYSEEGVIWRGKVAMNPIAEFFSSAKHVGGADLSGRIPWSQLAPPTLLVDGRIDVQLASNYLCGLRFSSSTDVSVISISSPESPKERAGFDKLFNYFQDRKRYGVIGKHPLPVVKDTYLIPIEAGATKKPEFIELLENNSLEDPTPERVLLVVFAIKTSDSNPPSHHGSQEPGASASPMTVGASTPQQPQFLTPGPRATSQISQTPSSLAGTPMAHAPYGQPQSQQQAPLTPQYSPFQPTQQQQAAAGIAAAMQVLGPQANSPAIQQLLQQAPNADVSQLIVVRDILQRRPETASNYDLLMQELVQATTNGHGAQQNAQ